MEGCDEPGTESEERAPSAARHFFEIGSTSQEGFTAKVSLLKALQTFLDSSGGRSGFWVLP